MAQFQCGRQGAVVACALAEPEKFSRSPKKTVFNPILENFLQTSVEASNLKYTAENPKEDGS
jgi:hypothetical protein